MTAPVRRGAAAPIQAAVYAALAGDQELSAMVGGRVHDHVPEPAVYPYVTVGEAVESPDDTLDRFGADTMIVVHVWSEYRGYAQGNAIAGRIQALLDRQPLTVSGHLVVAVRFKQTQPARDPDPQLRHVVVRFQVVTEQEEG
ncbi:MAG TPA: DUF3168 domain-containing protein [Micromonosporaceae bacterium]|nr:DUF3168 domain-containing protein [Micromonosporaceae bacterium]